MKPNDRTDPKNLSGKRLPEINLNKCGAKGDCISACPFDVLELKPITNEERKTLNLIGKMKTFFSIHKARVVHHDQCTGCGRCVQVCPENAIRLIRLYE